MNTDITENQVEKVDFSCNQPLHCDWEIKKNFLTVKE